MCGTDCRKDDNRRIVGSVNNSLFVCVNQSFQNVIPSFLFFSFLFLLLLYLRITFVLPCNIYAVPHHMFCVRSDPSVGSSGVLVQFSYNALTVKGNNLKILGKATMTWHFTWRFFCLLLILEGPSPTVYVCWFWASVPSGCDRWGCGWIWLLF